jgi:hypothetical protein
VPIDADVVVLVPQTLRLGQSLQHLSQLKIFGLLASLAGLGDDGGAFVEQLKREQGFDPTTAEGLAAAGLDPRGALIGAHSPQGYTVTVFPVADAAKFDAAIAKLVKERLRATVRAESEGMVTYAPPKGAPVAAWARRGGWAAFATGPLCTNAMVAALHQDAAHSLQAQAAYTTFEAAHRDADLVLYAPGAGLSKQLGLEGGLRLAATLAAHQLRAVAELPLSTAQATALASLQGGAGSELVGRLDPEAFLLARTSLDPAALWPVAQQLLPPQLGRQLVMAGVRPAEALANLTPGTAMSLSLPASMDLARMPSFDPRETNPFRYLYLAALGQVKDPAATRATLDGLQKFGPGPGTQLQRRDVGAVPVYTFTYALGDGASIALDGSRVAISGGAERMAPLLARAPGAGASLPPEVAARFNAAGLAAWLDVSRVVKNLRALPDSAFGLGGFAIRAALLRWLTAIEEIHDALLLADAKADATGTTLRLELQADLP